MGLDKSVIDESCPKDLEPYQKAKQLRMEEEDYMSWLNGMYFQSAVSVAIDHCFNGRKAKSEYIKEPILKKALKESKPLTQEEIEEQQNAFLNSLISMQEKFDKSHSNVGRE